MSISIVLTPQPKVFLRRRNAVQLPTKKATELLHFLIVHRGERFSRATLQKRFWPQADAAKAQNSLRQALYMIRKVLGDTGPIVTKRSVVYCRSRGVYESRNGEANTSKQIHLMLNRDPPIDREAFQSKLLSAFRSKPVDSFMQSLLAVRDTVSLDRESHFTIEFYLAYGFNELGRWNQALESAKGLINSARTRPEKVIAKHALGGILWHGGYFKEGLAQLWEACDLAGDELVTRSHVLSNVAIGAYEQRDLTTLQYANALAHQELRPTVGTLHHAVLEYLGALEAIYEHRVSDAIRQLSNLYVRTSEESPRLSVYMLEALSLAYTQSEKYTQARTEFKLAQQLRRRFRMRPSPIELQRLLDLKQEIKKYLNKR